MERDALNILEFFAIFKKRKGIFFLVVIPSFVASVTTSLLMTPIYRATATIALGKPIGSGPSAPPLGGLAGLGGLLPPDLSYPPSILSLSPGEIVKRFKSRSIAEVIIKKKQLLSLFFPQKKKWWNSFFPQKRNNSLPTLWDGIRFIDNELNVEYDRLSGTIEISFDFKDPSISADIIDEYIHTVSDAIKSDEIKTAMQIKNKLEKELLNISDVYLREKMFNLIVSQVERIALAETNSVFKVIDPPKAPDKKIKPKRKLIVVITLIGSLFISIFMILLKEHIERLKEQQGSSRVMATGPPPKQV